MGRRPDSRRVLGVGVLLLALAAATTLSVVFGANPLSPHEVWAALLAHDDSEASSIVWSLRIPRTLVGLVVGAAFGVAGALMQALTRNPLADPGILGVNAGAAFAVTLGVGVFGVTSPRGYVWFAFAGALLTTLAVHLIGHQPRGEASPVTLILAGVALSAVLTAASLFLTLLDEDSFRSIRAWGLGSLAHTSMRDLAEIGPFLGIGMILAVALGGALNALALGADQASALGVGVLRTRLTGLLALTLLAGGGTALTGGLAFIGLMVPHLARWFTGPDQRWVIVYSALAAPTILLGADVLGRVVARPGEIQAGVLAAVIGAPALVVLARRRRVLGP